MDRITRKELKTDHFAQDVGLTVTFFEQHKKDAIRYGGIAIAVVLLIIGGFAYQRRQQSARQEDLAQAIRVQETPVATVSASGGPTFPTEDAKVQASSKAFSDIQTKYSGSDEALVAEYYLGAIHSDQGKLAEAEKNFQDVADKAGKDYSSLGKLALAEIYYSDGRAEKGEKLLRELMENPTIFVSKDHAAIVLARHLTGKNNAEARKLLGPIKDGKGQVASIAQTMYAQLPPQ